MCIRDRIETVDRSGNGNGKGKQEAVIRRKATNNNKESKESKDNGKPKSLKAMPVKSSPAISTPRETKQSEVTKPREATAPKEVVEKKVAPTSSSIMVISDFRYEEPAPIEPKKVPPKPIEPAVKINFEKLAQNLIEDKLNGEIADFTKSLKFECDLLKKIRLVAYNRIQYIVTTVYRPYARTELFGSFVTDLSLPSSDIDILITGFQTLDAEECRSTLEQMSNELKKHRCVVNIKPILTASIPVVKLEVDCSIPFDGIPELNLAANASFRQALELSEDTPERISKIVKIDLTMEILEAYPSTMQAHYGLVSTEFSKKMLTLFRPLQELILLFKNYLITRGFNNTFKGGLSSYCVLILVTAFLLETANRNNSNLASLYIKLLTFYGEEFKALSTGITIPLDQCMINAVGPKPFFPKPKRPDSSLLFIMDPFNPMRNMTQYAYLFPDIQESFRGTLNRLEAYKGEVVRFLMSQSESLAKHYNPSTCKLLQHTEALTEFFRHTNSLQEILL
eukprot:TRINITY_DN4021_c0_g2_i2.p1 TRINITY_DN4021_c0_g2~~TRINITY_DN4021_c0_g2_i2.p1  ORF type:complete len:509 (+),score=108.26 TRINITY_DN4021_c0_g2_i2:64-1590(+)